MEKRAAHGVHCSYGLRVSAHSGKISRKTHLAHIGEDVENLNLLQPVAQPLVEEVNDAAACTSASSPQRVA